MQRTMHMVASFRGYVFSLIDLSCEDPESFLSRGPNLITFI